MTIDTFEVYYHLIHDRSYAFSGHRHNSFEVNIILKGCLEVTYGDDVFRLSQGDLFIGEPSVFHRNRVLSDEGAEFISLHFCSGDFSEEKSPAVFKLLEKDLLLVGILDDEIIRSDGRITQAAQNLLEALLLRLSGKAESPELSESENSAVYRKAATLMYAHIGESYNIQQIARLCGTCATTLKEAFAEFAGKGVKAYFIDMKMEKARKMLARGVAAEAVAQVLGFSSPAYFSQTFRRENGCSATEYKAKIKNAGKSAVTAIIPRK